MPNVLTINGGSSSIRFALFEVSLPPIRLLQGNLERIGSDDASLSVEYGDGSPATRTKADIKESAIGYLMDWLESQPQFHEH